MAGGYDEQKQCLGRTYTGMTVGRSHHWDYDGRWSERKLGPDTWEVDYRATKTRKGKGAPEGGGAPVGTEYLWMFAPAVQVARKPARQRAIRVLEQTLADLKADEREEAAPLGPPALESVRPVPPPRKKAAAKKAPAKKKGPPAALEEGVARGREAKT